MSTVSASSVASSFLQYFSQQITQSGAEGLRSLYSSSSTLTYCDENTSSSPANVAATDYFGVENVIKCLTSLEAFATLTFTSVDAVVSENDSVLISTYGEEVVNVFTIPFIRTFLLAKSGDSYYIKTDVFRKRVKSRNTKKVVMTAAEAEKIRDSALSIHPLTEAEGGESVSTQTEAKAVVDAEHSSVESSKTKGKNASRTRMNKKLAEKSSEKSEETSEVNATSETTTPVVDAPISSVATESELQSAGEQSSETSTLKSQTEVTTQRPEKQRRSRGKKVAEAENTFELTPASTEELEVKAETKTETKAPVVAPVEVKKPSKPTSWAAAATLMTPVATVAEPIATEAVVEKKGEKKDKKTEGRSESKGDQSKSDGRSVETKKIEKSHNKPSKIEDPDLVVYVGAIPFDMNRDAFVAAFLGEGVADPSDISEFTSGRPGNSTVTSPSNGQICFVTFETLEQVEDIVQRGKVNIHGTDVVVQRKKAPARRSGNGNTNSSSNATSGGFKNSTANKRSTRV